MSKILLGISGKKGSGKTFFADVFKNEAGKKGKTVELLSFATPLKKAANAIFGWSLADMEELTFKESVDDYWGVTPRKALQTLGTEWGRGMIREDIWLLAAQKSINESKADYVVFVDTRFPNEQSFITDQGGRVIHVRSGNDPDYPVFSEHVHESERNLYPGCQDLVLRNAQDGKQPLIEFAKTII